MIGLFQKVNFSYAQDNEETINLAQEYLLNEFYEKKDIIENTTSIKIDLGSFKWNLTGIELNFFNIKQENEIKTIEDALEGDKFLVKNKDLMFGVQINISESTILYGIYIFGYIGYFNLTSDVFVQINGYDNGNPNNIIYGTPIKLNMAYNILNWYYQNFSEPIPLKKGQYYLIINATKYKPDDNSRIFWSYSKEYAKNPNLNSSIYRTSWTRVQGEPFVYKLHQKINKTYSPQDINMKAEINGISYPILNGTNIGEGKLIQNTLDFKLTNNILNIPIKSDFSIVFNFTLNYRINLDHDFFTDGSVTIKSDSEIIWSIFFNLNRPDGNYTVKFCYPNSWTISNVFKENDPLTLNIDYKINTIEKSVYILNNTIPFDNLYWKITANSPNITISLKIQRTDYKIGEEILIEVLNPKIGNYTFVLYALGIEKYRDNMNYPSKTNVKFSYNLSSTAVSGNWTAYIYWNNETDAGVHSQIFNIIGISPIISGDGAGGGKGAKVITGLDPLTVFTFSSIIVIGAVASFTSYQTVKRVKTNREVQLKTLHSKFIDILSLNYLLITNKISGLNMYEQFFAGKQIDPALISGFLDAIRNFGIELTGRYQHSQTVKLEYQNSKILMSEFKDFRLILVLSENPSESFINSISSLCYDIEEKYGDAFRQFKGGFTTQFQGISELIEKHLNTSFISPLKITELKGLKLNEAEKAMINKALSIMKQNNLDYFFTSFLMPDQKYDPKKTRTIFNLIDKEIFVPIKLEQFNVSF